MNENNNELENNEDEELLEESQTRDNSKMVFLFLGVLTAIIAASVFYFLLKNSKPPIEIKTIERNVVKEKNFIEELKEKIKPKPKEVKPTLPALPKALTQVMPKVYIPKIIKGTGAKLSIGQNSSIKSNNIQSKAIALNAPKKPSIEPYTGGISTVAGIHHYDPNLFLVRGTFLPCSMDVKLISMIGGQITCTISEDIYSANGNVLLVEKGSTAVGTYKKTGLKNGMNRLYAIWEDIRTPNNIIISIGSGASDELGSAGMVGDVDNH
ncbi:MAG: TrbI/VirB10 family protein, partial [Desulfonauticus sp.]|nr:TrbI/VirB10 family protein [Desulfonauticus sp.]